MSSSVAPRAGTVLASLNASLHALMRDDPRVIVMGEDILDPYGGAFKVTKGLSTAYPERVITTPLSEGGFTAVAAGMALRGLRPIVEIMFGDFLALAADQLLNHIGKYRWMYNDQVRVPLVIRAPMGGRRGYGPTHSQTIEKHFLGMPGLHVVAPSVFHDPGMLLRTAVLDDDDPVIFIENKMMYARLLRPPIDGRVGDMHARTAGNEYPTILLSYDGFRRADVTIVAYGGMAELATEAAEHLLMEEEIYSEIVLPSQVSPFDATPVLDSLRRTGRLVVCEEGTQTAGWAAEVVAQISSAGFDLLRAAPQRVAARDLPIANTRTLEEAMLPQVSDIVRACLAITSTQTRVR